MSTCYQNGHYNCFYRNLQNFIFPYKANREAIHVQGTFHAFFTFLDKNGNTLGLVRS